jgi:hypothetical protein
VLFIVLFASALVRLDDQRIAGYVAVAVFVAMTLGTLDITARYLTNHLAIPGVGPNSVLEDVVAAEQLPKYGIGIGDKLAIIGDGSVAYWAELAKVNLVAEIMGGKRGAQEFWNASQETKKDVYRTFAVAHAKAVLSSCPAPGEPEWVHLNGTDYCLLELRASTRIAQQ